MGTAGRGRSRGWVGAAVLDPWAGAERTKGTEEGKLLGDQPV